METKPAPKKTAAKKPPVEREFVEVNKAAPAAAAPQAANGRKTVVVNAETKKSAAPYRWIALLLWVLALAANLLGAFMWLQGNSMFGKTEYWLYGGLVLAAILCLAGSFVWKRGNAISPPTSTGIKAALWNQMGIIATFIVFLPIGLLLILRSDKMSPQVKRVVLILAVALVALVGSLSASYQAPVAAVEPASAEEVQQMQANGEIPDNLTGALTDPAYWTQYGNSYHFDANCPTIMRSLKVFSGTLADAVQAKKLDACDICAHGKEQKGLADPSVVTEEQPADEAPAEETPAEEQEEQAPAA